jgi:hypothetical protein
MTSIAAWAAVDSRGASSVYIASDSRITWKTDESWDQGRKVFASNASPHIFGYLGDVLFPALAIPTILNRIDHSPPPTAGGGRTVDLEQAFRILWQDFPASQRRDLGILHAHRVGDGLSSQFMIDVLAYDAQREAWTSSDVPMPERSSFLRIEGSGARTVREASALWQASSSAGTSRAVFSAFCEAIATGGDPRSGGAPQLVGLYRQGPGRQFGMIYHGQRYLDGSRLAGTEVPVDLEWRNELFERVDVVTKRRLSVAQRHTPRSGGTNPTRERAGA